MTDLEVDDLDRYDSLLVPFVFGRLGAVCTASLPNRERFPAYLMPVFTSHFINKALCAACLRPMDEIRFRRLSNTEDGEKLHRDYLVCCCGHNVWTFPNQDFDAAAAITEAERKWRRRQKIKAAGGSHNKSEIAAILAIQKGRCIYCNRKFTIDMPYTKDHLLPLRYGGANYALNIVLACRTCNSRRCSTPFRTYCKHLSPTQNRRIISYLANRLQALDFNNLAPEATEHFEIGLALHDAKYFRNRPNSSHRHNTVRNKLLPRSIASLLKQAK